MVYADIFLTSESVKTIEDEKERDREQAERWYTGEAIVRELRRWQALHATFTALNQGYCH
ncbi:hypothetical protein CVV65_02770 [Kyrpidia spormannii]|uniref:Uncharacterized protein n=1 Tax=Kyrpidia spormannii TaxID=2055160 RepID=A0A2K8N608_9BACL|nr:hypothetical protein CVV65_02770 [Kyrpidia spormannii]